MGLGSVDLPGGTPPATRKEDSYRYVDLSAPIARLSRSAHRANLKSPSRLSPVGPVCQFSQVGR
jgi:hypothetical protein